MVWPFRKRNKTEDPPKEEEKGEDLEERLNSLRKEIISLVQEEPAYGSNFDEWIKRELAYYNGENINPRERYNLSEEKIRDVKAILEIYNQHLRRIDDLNENISHPDKTEVPWGDKERWISRDYRTCLQELRQLKESYGEMLSRIIGVRYLYNALKDGIDGKANKIDKWMDRLSEYFDNPHKSLHNIDEDRLTETKGVMIRYLELSESNKVHTSTKS